MKKLLKVILCLSTLSSVSSCSSKNTLEYLEFIEKLSNNETFTIMITQKTCSSCKAYKPEVAKFAKETKEVVYEIVLDDVSTTDKLSLAARIHDYFGAEYYADHNASSLQFITPTTIHFANGWFDYGFTEKKTSEELKVAKNAKEIELYNFYAFARKTANQEGFSVYFYKNKDSIDISSYERIYTLDINNLSENDLSRLTNRVSYFVYGEDEEKTVTLEDNFILKYEHGIITSYITK